MASSPTILPTRPSPVAARRKPSLGRIAACGALLLAPLASAGCASRYSVFSDYHSVLRETPQTHPDGKTAVVFLIDGLGADTLRSELAAGRLPNIAASFGDRVGVGRAVFPTLTYPNISSILTTRPIDEHPVIGNRIYYEGNDTLVNYEKPWFSRRLNEALAGRTVFSALTERHRNAVSFSYYFHEGTTSHLPLDLESGLAYAESDFGYVDRKVIDGLDHLLERTPRPRWPAFTFVHLIGVDGAEHRYGPGSPQALGYLRELDRKLGPLLARLREAESAGHPVTTLLTADHGFMRIERVVELEKPLARIEPGARIANGGRVMALTFPEHALDPNRVATLEDLPHRLPESVLASAWRHGDELGVAIAGGLRARLRYARVSGCGRRDYGLTLRWLRDDEAGGAADATVFCPEQLDALRAADPRLAAAIPRYLLSSLAEYFHSPYRPDALIVAAAGVSFLPGERGTHGGPTDAEFEVPLLARNARIAGPSDGSLPRTYDLLSFLREPTDEARPERPADVADERIPAWPAKLPGRDAEGLGFRHGLEVAAPVAVLQLDERFKADGSTAGFRSGLSPGLDLEWRQLWSDLLSSWVGYGIRFAGFDRAQLGGVAGADPDSTVAHRFSVGGRYRFGESSQVSLAAAAGQQYLAVPLAPAGVGIGGFALARAWVPELDFGTRTRVYSFGFADFTAGAGLGVLFPAGRVPGSPYPDDNLGFGFRKRLQAGLERPIGTDDLLTLTLAADQLSQDSRYLERSEWLFSLSASYGLSFLK